MRARTAPSRADQRAATAAVRRADPDAFTIAARTLGNRALRQLLTGDGGPAMRISKPGDRLEREADRIADDVMRQAEPTPVELEPAAATRPAAVQRMCAECAQDDDEGELQRKPANASADPGMAPPTIHDVTSSAGQPLDAATRAFMEPRFGRDFAQVRVHVDERASASARAVHAEAYTVGSHIVFSSSLYAPHTDAGKRLLAHELAHTIQQGAHAGAVQRRAVCPPGVDPEDGTGCYTVSDDSSPASPAAASSSQGFEIHTGGSAASGLIQGYDASVRLSSYVKPAEELAQKLFKDVQDGKISHLEGRDAAAAGRNELLQATRQKLSPGGRAFSKALKEEGKALPELIAKYSKKLLDGSPELMRKYGLQSLDPKSPLFDAAKYETAMADLAKSRTVSEEIIKAAGRPNGTITAIARFSKVAGPIATAAGVALSGYKIISAPEGEKLRVASREAGGFAGGMLGSVGGGLAAAWTASLVCGPGAVVCGVVISLVVVGASAYAGGRVGEAGGLKAYDSLSKGFELLGDTPRLIETTTNMFGSPEARRSYYELREIETGEPPPWEGF